MVGWRNGWAACLPHSQILTLPPSPPSTPLRQAAKVPASWEPSQGKKGVKRYTNGTVRELVRAREAAYDAKEKAQGGILQARVWGVGWGGLVVPGCWAAGAASARWSLARAAGGLARHRRIAASHRSPSPFLLRRA